jgi:hypothetical protein
MHSTTARCETDQLAKERWRKRQDDRNPSNTLQITGEPWPIYIQGTKISNNFQEAMYEQIGGKKAKEYWNTHKHRFGEGSIEDVDLQAATGDAMKTMPIARQHWLAKHAAGFNAVGKKYATKEVMDTLKMSAMLTHRGKFSAHHAMPRTRSARTMGEVHQAIRNLDESKSHGPKYCSSHKPRTERMEQRSASRNRNILANACTNTG